MKELALQAELLVKAFVKPKVAVLVVHDHRMAKLGEVETYLMQPAGFDCDPHECDVGEFLDDSVTRECAHRVALATGYGEVDLPFIIRHPADDKTEIFFLHGAGLEAAFQLRGDVAGFGD